MNKNPNSMNNRDISRAIKNTYGKILDDWKSCGLLPGKDTLFEGGVSPFAIPFILENYDLTDDEFLAIRNKLDSEEMSDDLIYSIKDIIKERNIDEQLLFSDVPLTPQQVITSFEKQTTPKFKKEYANWEFVSELFKIQPELLDPFVVSYNNSNEIKNFIVSLTNEIDFSKIDKSDKFLPIFCKMANDNFHNLEECFKNKTFLNEFCLLMAGEPLSLSFYQVGQLDIENPFIARTLLSGIYKRKKQDHLMLNGQVEPAFTENILSEMAVDKEYAKRQEEALQERRNNFLKEKALYGDFGLFYIKDNYSNPFWNKIEAFLSPEEIYKITEGNALKFIPLDKVDAHKAKIQKLILDKMEHHIRVEISYSGTSVASLFGALEFIPNGAQSLIFDKDFVKKINALTPLGNSEKINRHQRTCSLGLTDQREFMLSEKGLNEYLEIIKSLPNDDDIVKGFNKNLFLASLSYIGQFYAKDKFIPSTAQEYSEAIDKGVNLLQTLFNCSHLLKIDNNLTDDFHEHGRLLFDDIIYNVVRGTDTDTYFNDFKDKLVNSIMSSKESISLDEGYFYDCFNFANKVYKKLNKKDGELLKELVYLGNVEFSEDAPRLSNSIVNLNDTSNEVAVSLLLQSELYRNTVLEKNLQVPVSSLKNLVEYITCLESETEDEKNIVSSMENFLVDYISVNREQEDIDTIIFPDGYEEVLPNLKTKLEETTSLEKLVEYAQKNKDFKNINELLSYSANEQRKLELLEIVAKSGDRAIKDHVMDCSSVSINLLHKAGFNDNDLIRCVASNQQKMKQLFSFDMSANFKEKLISSLNKSCNDDFEFFKDFLGGLSQNDKGKEFAINFIKENNKYLLLSNHFKYIYQNVNLKDYLTANDFVEAAKDLVEKAKELPSLLKQKPIFYDVFGEQIPKEQWKNAIENQNLTAEEKLVLNKYASFAAQKCYIYTTSDTVDNVGESDVPSDVYQAVKSLVGDNIPLDVNRGINDLNIFLTDIFQPEFIRENKEVISKVYFPDSSSLKEFCYNNLGVLSSYSSSSVNTKEYTFVGNSEWVKLVEENLFKDDTELEAYLNAFQSSNSLKDSVLNRFNLSTEYGIERLFVLLKNDKRKNDFQFLNMEEKIDNFFNEVFKTIYNATEDTQYKFIKMYDALSLGLLDAKHEKSSLEKRFFKNKEIKDGVQSIRLKNKINKALDDGLNQAPDQFEDDFGSFKM